VADAPRLAVSNIAWETNEDDEIAELLLREGVVGVELAPTKWRDRPFDATEADISAFRRSWEDRGLRVVSLQALLFGRPDLQLFGAPAVRAELASYMRRAIDFGAAVGATALVFGSPKNRVRGAMPVADAMAIASEVFRSLGEHAYARDVVLCIEPNPPDYGCDFVTTLADAIQLCRAVDHPGVRINADVGGLTLAAEPPFETILSAAGLVGHVHASEPHLVEIGSDARTDHHAAARGLASIGYNGWTSLEMRTTGDNVRAIGRALNAAKANYRAPLG
jgi:D-psicose/D-tagatose/L-ribulose 3-epimerase